jgi:hypothetical protein
MQSSQLEVARTSKTNSYIWHSDPTSDNKSLCMSTLSVGDLRICVTPVFCSMPNDAAQLYAADEL